MHKKVFFLLFWGLNLVWYIEGKLVADFAFYLGPAGGFGWIEVAARSSEMPLDLTSSLLAFSSEPGIVRSGQSSRVLFVD